MRSGLRLVAQCRSEDGQGEELLENGVARVRGHQGSKVVAMGRRTGESIPSSVCHTTPPPPHCCFFMGHVANSLCHCGPPCQLDPGHSGKGSLLTPGTSRPGDNRSERGAVNTAVPVTLTAGLLLPGWRRNSSQDALGNPGVCGDTPGLLLFKVQNGPW